RLRDRPGGHKPAVAPPANAQAIRVRQSNTDHMIDPRQYVQPIATAHVPNVGFGIGRPAPTASPDIRQQHQVAAPGKILVPPLPPYRVMRQPSPGRTTVYLHEGRVAPARFV